MEKEKLEFAIYVLNIRIFQLEKAVEDCLLCQKFVCEGCPASKADYSCGAYYADVGAIVEKLRAQAREWIDELAKGT